MDLDFIQQQMEENRNVSIQMRDKIREYGIEHFSWNNLIKDYINIIEHM
jgi:glycosyltransferase involved in cell wall biosynthesis